MRLPISSWSLFIITTLGLVVLLVGQRPELQGSEGRTGPGQTVRIVGHAITWSAAAALTVRMIRSARSKSASGTSEHEKPKQMQAKPSEPVV